MTHEFTLEQLPQANELFSRQGDGVMKVAIYPSGVIPGRIVARETAGVEC